MTSIMKSLHHDYELYDMLPSLEDCYVYRCATIRWYDALCSHTSVPRDGLHRALHEAISGRWDAELSITEDEEVRCVLKRPGDSPSVELQLALT